MNHINSSHHAGNGEMEKYNGIVLKLVTMACPARNLHIKYWQVVLPDVLHFQQSLLFLPTKVISILVSLLLQPLLHI